MVVIADTSPINYLILIGADHVLHDLYGQIVVPSAVIRELKHSDTPDRILQWIATPPTWLKIEQAPAVMDPILDQLGAGERDAIILAETKSEEVLLLIDEARGRNEASRRNLTVTGTLGVLDAAAEARLLDLPTVVSRLRETSFHVTPALLKRLLDRDVARQQR